MESLDMSLEKLLLMSHRYGADEDYVLAGGGNTSYKENGVLYIKGSGTQLSDITQGQFVAMGLQRLRNIVVKDYATGLKDSEREERVLADMMAARLPGEEAKRPSVETMLHAIFPYSFVLHTHPALINGMTCSRDGKAACKKMFGDMAVWIDVTKPGLILAQVCNKLFNALTTSTGSYPQLVFLENHGVFAAANTTEEIDSIMEYAVKKIKGSITGTPDFSDAVTDDDLAHPMASAIKAICSANKETFTLFCTGEQILEFVSSPDSFKPLMKSFTPDHIVYCKGEPLFLEQNADIYAELSKFSAENGYRPGIVVIRGLGFLAIGKTRKETERALMLFKDAIKIAVYAESFGGVNPLDDEFTEFILNWEAEMYRNPG
jgi:rhamnose utilization protein RhaD (predicted bifunctional aldolase and dehydrogenase)